MELILDQLKIRTKKTLMAQDGIFGSNSQKNETVVHQIPQVQYLQGVQKKKMFLVAEHQYLESVFVEVGIVMIFNGNGKYLLSERQELAKRKLYRLGAEINKKAPVQVRLEQSMEFRSVNHCHSGQN